MKLQILDILENDDKYVFKFYHSKDAWNPYDINYTEYKTLNLDKPKVYSRKEEKLPSNKNLYIRVSDISKADIFVTDLDFYKKVYNKKSEEKIWLSKYESYKSLEKILSLGLYKVEGEVDFNEDLYLSPSGRRELQSIFRMLKIEEDKIAEETMFLFDEFYQNPNKYNIPIVNTIDFLYNIDYKGKVVISDEDVNKYIEILKSNSESPESKIIFQVMYDCDLNKSLFNLYKIFIFNEWITNRYFARENEIIKDIVYKMTGTNCNGTEEFSAAFFDRWKDFITPIERVKYADLICQKLFEKINKTKAFGSDEDFKNSMKKAISKLNSSYKWNSHN